MRQLALILLACCLGLLAFPIVTIADENQHREFRDLVKIPIRLAPVYNFVGAERIESAFPTNVKIPLRQPSTQAPGDQIGSTYYDIQHNCTMGRQVEHDERHWPDTDFRHIYAWYISFAYTGGGPDWPRIYYDAYSIDSCAFVFGGLHIANGRYVCIDSDTGWALPAVTDEWPRPCAYFDLTVSPQYGVFIGDGPGDINGGYELAPNLWPKIEWDIDAPESVLHMVATESAGGNARTISYYRRTGPYGAGLGVWSSQRVIDTVTNISVTVAASPISNKVAIIWNAPADYKRDTPDEFSNQYENDVWYAVSENLGADFIIGTPVPSIGWAVENGLYNGGNITGYSACGDYKAFSDLSALISQNTDNVHIVWGCRRWDCDLDIYRRRSAIFHWSEATDTITTVVKAEWDTGGECFGYYWGSDAAKMTISECDGKLYVLYTQFGSRCYPCVDYDAENNIMNGELFLAASSDGGLRWDQPQNLTNTETPNCMSGNCESDYWASMARYGRLDTCGGSHQRVLDILYINDKAPGGCVTPESGVLTENPVMWLTTPCRPVGPVPDSFYFVHITDTHIGSLYHYGSGDRLSKAKNMINSFSPPPAFVIVSGDLVAYGADTPGWLSYLAFKDIMDDLNMPYYTCPGNHDTRYDSSLYNYTQHWPKLDYIVDIDTLGIRLISLFSGYDKSTCCGWETFCLWGVCITVPWFDHYPEGSGLTPVQYDSLSGWLNDPSAADLKKIVFLHHPVMFCSKDYAQNDQERNCGNACIWEQRYDVWQLLRQDPARVVLSGHTHKNDYQYRSDDHENAERLPMADWYHTECDTNSGLLPLHVNTGALCEDLAYRIIAVEGPDVKVSRTYYFDKTATTSAYWIRTEGEGSKRTGLAPNDTLWPAGRVHVWDLDNNSHVGYNPLGDSIDFQIEGAYYSCPIDTGDIPESSTEIVSVILSDTLIPGDFLYVIEYKADTLDSSVVIINTGYTKQNGCRAHYTHSGIPAPSGTKGWIYVYFDHVDTMLYWDYDSNGIPDSVYPPGDYFVYSPCEVAPCTPGDANNDGAVNVGDAVYVIAYVFKGGPPPCTCEEWLVNCGQPLRK
jgi:3',5'-cyclic AMP phosphodiesterase CpdA